MSLKEINLAKVSELYFSWKKFNDQIKGVNTRGVNLHEAITEGAVCLVNDYVTSNKGSEDAIDFKTEHKIQIKGTSNFESDLSSFGPRSEFDELHFVRVNSETDNMHLYRIPIDNLYSVEVNKKETFRQQQLRGIRPRFSIIQKYIIKKQIEAYAVIDLRNSYINYKENYNNVI